MNSIIGNIFAVALIIAGLLFIIGDATIEASILITGGLILLFMVKRNNMTPTPTPKEALELAETLLNEFCLEDGDEEIILKIKAAIPVAELHAEMVELLNDIPTFCLPTKDAREWWQKIKAIRTKIKALK